MTTKRICVIGAGPSGMSTLYHFGKLKNRPNIVCYEKQKTWGGMWNYNWRTGLDEYGEHCHNGMYKDLIANLPKEVNIETHDYTFQEHFGDKTVPSYASRADIRNYFDGRWKNASDADLTEMIKFNAIVRQVRYIDDDSRFSVTVENQETGETATEIFTHCVVATGIFSFPNTPSFPGFETFNGRILHSHDFRHGEEFKDKSILIIGASLSAEDIAMNCISHGASRVIISWRTKPLNHKWPPGIEERPLFKRVESEKVVFQDDSEENIDSIIMCTGYKNHFPFLESRLRIASQTTLYPAGLYKGTLFTTAANNKLFYIGVQRQFYAVAMFDSLAAWVCKYIMGMLSNEPKSKDEMEADCKLWIEEASKVSGFRQVADFATKMMVDLTEQTGYQKAISSMESMILNHRDESITEYKRKHFKSVYSDTQNVNVNKYLPHGKHLMYKSD